MPLKLSPKAHADLDAIWNYTVQQWNVEQAEIYLASLGKTMRLIADNPGLGTKIDQVKSGYLKFPAASHLLIYKSTPTAIEVIRILHKRMDVESQIAI